MSSSLPTGPRCVLPVLLCCIVMAACAPGRSGGETDAADPPGDEAEAVRIRVVSQERCGEALCHELAVSCRGLLERFVVVRELEVEEPRGAVLFTTGGDGSAAYDNVEGRAGILRQVLGAGLEAFLVEWRGEDGWVTGVRGAGFERALCAYAEVARWIVALRADVPEVVCAQGNSGGALQNAYGLAVYGLEELLDMVVLSGGPPVTNVLDFCAPEGAERLKENLRRKAERTGRGSPLEGGAPPGDESRYERRRRLREERRRERLYLDEEGTVVLASVGRTLTDKVMGWEGGEDFCKRLERPVPVGESNLATLTSLLPMQGGASRDLRYPRTRLNFVGAAGDHHFSEQGRRFFEVVDAPKAWHELPGREHGIDQTPEGSARIAELLSLECRPW